MKTWFALLCVCATVQAADIRLGLIGTDTSHVTAFTKLLNDASSPDHIPGARVVAAYKGGSPDIEESRSRIDRFTNELRDRWQIKIVDSIEELCKQVDAVLLMSVDGRVHLAQARIAIAAHKPLFIDKPLSATLEDGREIARLAKEAHVPWFSASSLRFSEVARLRNPEVTGAITWGPGPMEEHHKLDLSWYAIHPIEMLFTILGPGCQEVTRTSSDDADVVSCRWSDGRIGTVRALRPYGEYGAIAFHRSGRNQTPEVLSKVDSGYVPLLREIVQFFQTGHPPVPNEETLEIFAFMDAAQRSKEAHGQPMSLRK